MRTFLEFLYLLAHLTFQIYDMVPFMGESFSSALIWYLRVLVVFDTNASGVCLINKISFHVNINSLEG